MINNKGFTLIETAISLAIVTIIAALGVNRYSKIQEAADINEDMHKISTFLKSKRLTAFTSKNDIGIVVTPGGMSITATLDPSGTPVSNGAISLNYAVAPIPAVPPIPGAPNFTINSRGLFSTPGNIHLAAVNNSAANSCVIIAAERIRLGEWDGTNCTAK